MPHTRQIIINTISGWGSLLIRAVIALALVPFLISHLGKEGFGLVGLLTVILGITQIADLGLQQALGRHLAGAVAKDDSAEFNQLASTAFLLYLVLAAVIASAYYLSAPQLVSLFKIPADLVKEAVVSVRLYGVISVLLAFLNPVFHAGLVGHNRFDLIHSINIVNGVVAGALLFLFLPHVTTPIYGWIAMMLATQSLSLILTVAMFFRTCPGAALSTQNIKTEKMRPLLGLGSNLFLLRLASTLAEQADPLIVSYFHGPRGVSLYTPGGKLANLMRPIVMTLGNQLYPLTTRHHIDGQRESLVNLLLAGTRYTLLMGSLASVLSLVFAEPFCRLWLENSLGDDYLVATRVMQAWALATFFMYVGGTQWSIGLGMNKLRFYAWILLPSAVLNIGMSIYLVGYTDMGIPGVVVATIITEFFRRIILFVYCTRILQIEILESAKSAYGRPLIVTAAMVAASLLIASTSTLSDWPSLAFAVISVAGIWGLLTFFIGATKPEKSLLMAGIRKSLS